MLLGQTRDSIVKVSVTHDTSFVTTTKTTHDSTYVIKVQDNTNSMGETHYLNNISAWYYNATTQDQVIKWAIAVGSNRLEIYGVDGIISDQTKWKWISRFNDSCSAHNIQTSFIWSDPNTVTVGLDKFEKAQTRQQAKFDLIKNESEPYNNTVSYQLWWQQSRQVLNWCIKNNKLSGVYVGWHTQQSYDSIRVLYNWVDIHVYKQSAQMSDPKALYDYASGRLLMLCNTPGLFNYGIINSDETAFAYTYYVSINGDFKKPVSTYQQGFNTYASSKIKSQAKMVNHETFVSSYSWQIKPYTQLSQAARMAFKEVQYRKVLFVDPNTGISRIIKCKTLGQIKSEEIK